jgi:hypothetical protein
MGNHVPHHLGEFPADAVLCVYQQVVYREPTHFLSDSCCARKIPLVVFIIAIQTADLAATADSPISAETDGLNGGGK